MTDHQFKEGDIIVCPAVDAWEGQVLKVDGSRVQVWWSDDAVSWEDASDLQPYPR